MSMMLAHAVDEAFERMSHLYGREFTSKFDPDETARTKAAWVHELQAMPMVLERIAWALRHLPERCPNAITFRNLCQQAPMQQQAMETDNTPTRGPTADELQAIKALRDSIAEGTLLRRPSRRWAHDLIAKHERGEPVGSYPLKCAREVAAMHPLPAEPSDPEDYLTP